MEFWRPGAASPGVAVDHNKEETNEVLTYNSNQHLPIDQQRKALPISKHRTEIVYALEQYSTLIIQGSTGSGKSTQIPQYLDESGWTFEGRTVACTSPRRSAAIALANRVSEEMGCEVGSAVGYAVRFDCKCRTSGTRIKYMTDGMLIRETRFDPLLSMYSVVIVDEAHERSVSTDLLLGLLKKIQRKRPHLKIIISSATINCSSFYQFFHGKEFPARILSIESNRFPIDHFFLSVPISNYVHSTVECIMKTHETEGNGHILAFLPGKAEIDETVGILQQNSATSALKKLVVLPLYAGLSTSEQLKVFDGSSHDRKCIVSTNVAETSVTIPGIRYVVDSGLCKQKSFNPFTGIEYLQVSPISKASSIQRAGRAGRECSGKCYHLFTRETFERDMSDETVPEIERTSLISIVLHMKSIGIHSIDQFDFMYPPPIESIVHALEMLHALGALDDLGMLTDAGVAMADIPLDPRMAKVLLSAGDLGCSEEALTIVAMSSVDHLYVSSKRSAENQRKKYWVTQGDLITLLNIYNAFVSAPNRQSWCASHYVNMKSMRRVQQIRKQLKECLQKLKVPLLSSYGNAELIQKSILSGFFANAAQLQRDGTYLSVRGNETIKVHPSSVLYMSQTPWIVFQDVSVTCSKFARNVTKTDPQWFFSTVPRFYQFHAPKQ